MKHRYLHWNAPLSQILYNSDNIENTDLLW